jgi:hypothetical protein
MGMGFLVLNISGNFQVVEYLSCFTIKGRRRMHEIMVNCRNTVQLINMKAVHWI